MKMKIETSDVAGVAKQNESNGRSGIPLIGLLPGSGRLFSAPTKDSSLTDVVITVTPHTLRAPTYTDADDTAVPAGTQTAPDRQISIEEILYRAETEEATPVTRVRSERGERFCAFARNLFCSNLPRID